MLRWRRRASAHALISLRLGAFPAKSLFLGGRPGVRVLALHLAGGCCISVVLSISSCAESLRTLEACRSAGRRNGGRRNG
eukprot:8122319-Heterocapsa_arctica.AAC.1